MVWSLPSQRSFCLITDSRQRIKPVDFFWCVRGAIKLFMCRGLTRVCTNRAVQPNHVRSEHGFALPGRVKPATYYIVLLWEAVSEQRFGYEFISVLISPLHRTQRGFDDALP